MPSPSETGCGGEDVAARAPVAALAVDVAPVRVSVRRAPVYCVVAGVSGAGPVTRAMLAGAGEDLDERAVARRLCRSCVDGLDVDGAAVSLLTGRSTRVTVAVTDPVARQLEDLQFAVNEGVCLDAARTGTSVLVPDVRGHTAAARWPLFADAVVELTEVSALFALPLQWGVTNLGVLDLYRTVVGGLADRQWYDVVAAVETASLLILGRRTMPPRPDAGGGPAAGGRDDDGLTTGGWLSEVAGYRAEIHQATGMVQVQLGLSGVDALARLRSHAFAEQRLLLDVARDVVDRRLVFSEGML